MIKVLTLFLCFCISTSYSFAQFEFLKKKAEEKIEQAIEGQEEEKQEEEQKQEEKLPEEKKVEPVKAELKSYTKYDFVPGDKTLFYEDFSQDAIGDFPQLWTTNGSGEVRSVDTYAGKWLYVNSDEHVYCLMKDLLIPDNFIFEFDVLPNSNNAEESNHASFYFSFFNSNEDFLQDALYPGSVGFHVGISDAEWSVQGYQNESDKSFPSSSSQVAPLKLGNLNHIIVWVQKRRIRIYHDGQKVIDGPTALAADAKYNRFRLSMWGQTGKNFFSNLKITSAAPDTRTKLLTDGKLISYGIYFDINKDIVKPESYGALNDIAKVLKDNPTVKIKIVGHTDSDGKPETNLSLSKKRAESVKNSLVSVFGIEAIRIETDGKGQTEPIEDNSTAQGKASNRRVEFIKL